MAFNPELGSPGGCLSKTPPNETDINYLARYVIWSGTPHSGKCRTKFVRQVCILGHANVEDLKRAPHLFANKFYEDFEPGAYDELERWYIDRTHAEWLGADNEKQNTTFTPTAYANLQCSKHHLP